MEIVAIVNRKGGVGKTATAHALGAGLQQRGYRVLFLDLDSQKNLSFKLAADLSGDSPTIWDALTGAAAAADCIQHTAGGDIVPADNRLSGADLYFTEKDKFIKLRDALEPLQTDYDYIVIDTPTVTNITVLQALTAAQSVIIAAQADTDSLQGLSDLYGIITQTRDRTNPALTIKGILLTRHNGRARFTKQITEQFKGAAYIMGTTLYSTAIRECIAIKETAYMQQDIFTYAPKSNGAADYNAFVDEFLQQKGEI